MKLSRKEYGKIHGNMLYIAGILMDCQRILGNSVDKDISNMKDKDVHKLLSNIQTCIEKSRTLNAELDETLKRKIDADDIENINETKELLENMLSQFEEMRWGLVLESVERTGYPVIIV